MSSSFIWDWNEARTDDPSYKHVAMIGNCRGLIINDPYYYEVPSVDIREHFYSDRASNLEQLSIL
jgi:hypothetical protein